MWIGDATDEQTVRIIDDAVNDDGETVKVRISNARLEKEDDDGDPTNDVVKVLDITRAVATGTIHNEGSLQRARLARFGRTVGTHVTDAVSERMRRGPERESHLTFGGQRLALGECTREPHLTMRGQHLALGERTTDEAGEGSKESPSNTRICSTRRLLLTLSTSAPSRRRSPETFIPAARASIPTGCPASPGVPGPRP